MLPRRSAHSPRQPWSEMSDLPKINYLFTVIPIHPENCCSNAPKLQGEETPSCQLYCSGNHLKHLIKGPLPSNLNSSWKDSDTDSQLNHGFSSDSLDSASGATFPHFIKKKKNRLRRTSRIRKRNPAPAPPRSRSCVLVRIWPFSSPQVCVLGNLPSVEIHSSLSDILLSAKETNLETWNGGQKISISLSGRCPRWIHRSTEPMSACSWTQLDFSPGSGERLHLKAVWKIQKEKDEISLRNEDKLSWETFEGNSAELKTISSPADEMRLIQSATTSLVTKQHM